MITAREDSNWVSIAEQLGTEMDEAKLAILVKRLCFSSWMRATDHPLKTRRRETLSKSSHPAGDSQHKSEFSLTGAVFYKKDPIYCVQ